MTTRFSFEDAQGPTAGGDTFVPASRTSKQKKLSSAVASSGVRGELPKDRTIYDALVAAADEYGVPREAAFALAQQESGYNVNAHNSEYGADGLMQFIKSTAEGHGLKYGVDTRDPVKASRAAMKDFAAQMAIGGVDWAIKHHFAGPDVKGHGPKTRQYLADVTQRMNDIRGLLSAEQNPAAAGGAAGSAEGGPKQQVGSGKKISFEEALGPQGAVEEEEESGTGFVGFIKDQFAEGHILDAFTPVKDGLSSGLDFVLQRIKDQPDEYLGQRKVQVERTPEEIEEIIRGYDKQTFRPGPVIGRAAWLEEERKRLRFKEIYLPTAEQESQDIIDRNKPEENRGEGFLANVKNPMDLIMNDSLPANVVEWATNAPKSETKKFFDARKVAQQQHIVDNPDKFPAVSVEAAKQAIAEREAKQDPTIRQMWKQLKEAAKEDPGKFGAEFANALLADPEMLLAPQGIGLKVIRKTKQVATGAAGSSKALKLADKIIDAGVTGAGLNTAIELAHTASEGKDITAQEAGFAAMLGGGVSALFGGVFHRGAVARRKLQKGGLNGDDLDAAMKDAAAEDILTEELVNADKTDIIWGPDGKPMPADVRSRIEKNLGIEHMSPDQRKAWHKKQQAELSKMFKEQWSEADYLKYKAEERITRASVLAEDAQRKAAEAAELKAREEQVLRDYVEPRRPRFEQEYAEALAAREAADARDIEGRAHAENKLRDITSRLDQQDIIEAAFQGDKALDDAMRRALARDSKLRVPKWQRGDIDPKLVARLGIGSLFAGTAYAVAPEEQKGAAAFTAGLAGLMIPAGGSVLSRMRQAGTISGDTIVGDVARLVSENKLKPDVDITEARIRETEQVNRAIQGDQRAVAELYKEHLNRTIRQAKKALGKAGARIGVDAEDIAQEAFIDAFKNLASKRPETNFGAWVYGITQKKAIDAIRSAQTLKGGADVDFQGTDLPNMKDPFGDSYSRDIFDEGATQEMPGWDSPRNNTPEYEAMRQDSERILMNAVKNELNENEQLAFLLNKVEGYNYKEIAGMMGVSDANAAVILNRAAEKVQAAIARGYNAKPKAPKVETQPTGEKRGRGRPRKIQAQAGEIDPRLLKLGAVAALGAGAGAYLNEQNKLLGAGIGAAVSLMFASKAMSGKSHARNVIDSLDYTAGITSTRIMNKSVPLWRRAVEHERIVLRDTHKHLKAGDNFLLRLNKLKNKDTRDVLTRAILTGKGEVTNRLLNKLNDPELIAGWKEIRSSLDSLKDQLVALRRFKPTDIDYFPRIVKDVDGLLKALGRERGGYLEQAIKDADEKAIRTRGTGLTDLERSQIINKVLREDQWTSQQPGFAKYRGVEEITPELQQYYATPLEAYHSYVRSAVEDIQRAKFFGQDLKVITKGNQEYTNVGESIGTLTNRLMNEGKLKPKDAEEVAGLLRSRFLNGEKSPHEIIQSAKNLAYSGLLGNPWSAVTQMGDVIVQAFVQDTRSTLQAVVRKLTGRSQVNMRDFGLADHIAEEFVSTSTSQKFLRTVFMASLFKGVDSFGKNVSLNAAIIRAARLSKSEAGIKQLQAKWGEALQPKEFEQLIKDLQKGEATDLVQSVAFAELSRSQPITRLEMPQAYLDHPNGRVFYMLKTFMLKQIDMVRRDGYNEIKKGNIAKGVKNLTELGLVLGLAGTTTQKIKDFLYNRDVDFAASDIPMNMFKTFGLSQYFADHFFGVSKEEAKQRRAAGDKKARKINAEPLEAIGGVVIPPYKMFDDIVTGDPEAIRYIPLVGPWYYEQYKAQKAKENQSHE